MNMNMNMRKHSNLLLLFYSNHLILFEKLANLHIIIMRLIEALELRKIQVLKLYNQRVHKVKDIVQILNEINPSKLRLSSSVS